MVDADFAGGAAVVVLESGGEYDHIFILDRDNDAWSFEVAAAVLPVLDAVSAHQARTSSAGRPTAYPMVLSVFITGPPTGPTSARPASCAR